MVFPVAWTGYSFALSGTASAATRNATVASGDALPTTAFTAIALPSFLPASIHSVEADHSTHFGVRWSAPSPSPSAARRWRWRTTRHSPLRRRRRVVRLFARHRGRKEWRQVDRGGRGGRGLNDSDLGEFHSSSSEDINQQHHDQSNFADKNTNFYV